MKKERNLKCYHSHTHISTTNYNKLQEIEKEIEESLKQEKQQIYLDFNKQIVEHKEPYLTELLKSLQNDTELEKKYTAHDILTVLESLADQYPVDID